MRSSSYRLEPDEGNGRKGTGSNGVNIGEEVYCRKKRQICSILPLFSARFGPPSSFRVGNRSSQLDDCEEYHSGPDQQLSIHDRNTPKSKPNSSSS